MSEDTLRQLKRSIEATRAAHGSRFKAIEHIDTTDMEPRGTAVKITEKALGALMNFVDEEICVVPADIVSNQIPSKGLVEDRATVDTFVDLANSHKRFVRRSQAEGDPTLIQPIPCAIIRWKEQILLLRRKKKGHALHEKYLLWAGGHVNTSDDSSAILVTALERELSEEIFIKGAYRMSDRPVLRTDEDARASRHIGVLYEITLSSDDVALALNQQEFKETRGTSMSGRLVDPETLPESSTTSLTIGPSRWSGTSGPIYGLAQKPPCSQNHKRKACRTVRLLGNPPFVEGACKVVKRRVRRQLTNLCC